MNKNILIQNGLYHITKNKKTLKLVENHYNESRKKLDHFIDIPKYDQSLNAISFSQGSIIIGAGNKIIHKTFCPTTCNEAVKTEVVCENGIVDLIRAGSNGTWVRIHTDPNISYSLFDSGLKTKLASLADVGPYWSIGADSQQTSIVFERGLYYDFWEKQFVKLKIRSNKKQKNILYSTATVTEKEVITGCFTGHIHIFSRKNGKHIASIDPEFSLTVSHIFERNGFLFVGYGNGSLCIYERESRRCLQKIPNLHYGCIKSIVMLDDKFLITGGLDGSVVFSIWRENRIKVIKVLKQCHVTRVFGGKGIYLHKKRTAVIIGNNAIRIYTYKSDRKIELLGTFFLLPFKNDPEAFLYTIPEGYFWTNRPQYINVVERNEKTDLTLTITDKETIESYILAHNRQDLVVAKLNCKYKEICNHQKQLLLQTKQQNPLARRLLPLV
jgi:hypothetical protein